METGLMIAAGNPAASPRTSASSVEPRGASAITGAGIEELVIASAGREVCLTKLPGAVRFASNGRRSRGKGPADFMGICRANRRLIVFDTAECRHRHRLLLGESVLPASQRQVLVHYGTAGGVAGLLAAATHRQLHLAFWLPWNALIRPIDDIGWTDDRLIEIGPLSDLLDFSLIPGVGEAISTRRT
jgi:hypothetical protein